jgi:hypothetical protein
MVDELEAYRQFILSADTQALIKQLRTDIKSSLVSAENLVNVLIMMQEPTEAIQQKIDAGELDAREMLVQTRELINQVFDLIDFYNTTLSEG